MTGLAGGVRDRFRSERGVDEAVRPREGAFKGRNASEAVVGVMLEIERLGVGERRLLGLRMTANLKRGWECHGDQQPRRKQSDPTLRAEPHG